MLRIFAVSWKKATSSIIHGSSSRGNQVLTQELRDKAGLMGSPFSQ